MMLPGVLTIGFPIAIVLFGKLVYGDNSVNRDVRGYMAGAVSGVLWAVFQNNAGGAWDMQRSARKNAKHQ
jgi:K(+)-stimulated pyrophosphate-energized sodium pump